MMATIRSFLQQRQQKRIEQQKNKESIRQKQLITVSRQVTQPAFDIAPNDPLITYFLASPNTLEVDKLHLDSPALKALKAADVKVAVPLVSNGELVGMITLGPRLSEQDYSTYDKGLLNSLATQAAPALRVAQLVREQQAQARERERIEQELQIARLIQQTLLPQELPTYKGWHFTRYYQPAREVGGDFYDFLYHKDGRLGLVIGDVTGKGVPAALVMATTRSILRSAAQGAASPGLVLEQTNDLLHPDIPPNMFVTCLYAILDPQTGVLQYANAGHDLPYRSNNGEIAELRATGMPLGLMQGMRYEEKETILVPGERVLFHSDGLVEAHNQHREMFGFPRLMSIISTYTLNNEGLGEADASLIDFLLEEMHAFTGDGWEQEDDVTLMVLQWLPEQVERTHLQLKEPEVLSTEIEVTADWQVVDEWTVASQPGNERAAIVHMEKVLEPIQMSQRRLEQLKTAVAEATMNAMEHGNQYDPDMPVTLQVLTSQTALAVRISDQGGGQPIPEGEHSLPDIEAKLAELQSPRGWGLFLIKSMVDDMHTFHDKHSHTIELILSLEGENHAS